MLARLFIFLIFIIQGMHNSLCCSESEHKIVYLISGPRALSTVFLRMIESRGDFIIYHEPTVPVYDKVHYADLTESWFRKDANVTFEEVKGKLFESQKKSNVFIKDMSFSSHPYILNDLDFIKNPSVQFLFLVRNPHHSSISFYLKVNDIVPGMSDLIGLKKLFELYEQTRNVNPKSAKIIFSEQLYNEPRLTMAAICTHLDIPFSEKAFKWKKYDENFQGFTEWDEQKVENHINHWHGRAIQSEQIEKPRVYEVNQNGIPTFGEISNEEHRAAMNMIYQENLIYYKKFLHAKEGHLMQFQDD